jgi:hypothetical protein
MAIDLEIWWLRSLAFIIVIPFLGPNLVAIGKMVLVIDIPNVYFIRINYFSSLKILDFLCASLLL